MTDPTPLSDEELDLAASLAIDGQESSDQPMSDDDRRRVEARMTELRPAVVAVGEPVTPPTAEVRDGQIAAALAAASDRVTDGVHDVVVAPRADRRSTRRRARVVAPWAAAAAAAVLVVVALASLAGRGGSHSASTSATFQPVAGAVEGRSTTTAPLSPQSRQYEAGRGLDTLADLGSVATVDQLDALARTALTATTTTTGSDGQLSSGGLGSEQATSATTTTPALGPSKSSSLEVCIEGAGSLRPPLGDVVLRARATVATRPVVIVVYEARGATDGQRYLLVLEMPSCRVLVDRPL